MNVSRTVVLLACVTLLLVAGCMSRPDLRPGRTMIKGDRTIVPAQVIGSHFVVDAKWDKHGPWHFLIDTGSSVTLVSEEFAKRYATERPALYARGVRVKSAKGDSTTLPPVTLRRLSLGQARFENVQALVADLSEISNHLGIQIDAVLGFPLFRDTVFTLDYPGNRLIVLPSGFAINRPGSTIYFNNAQRTPLIPIEIGGTSLIALIDSGSDGPLFLNTFGLDVKFVATPRPGTTVGTLTGNRTQDVARLSTDMFLGAYEFKQPIVDLTDQLSSLGGEILRNFSVTFDQRHNRVTFYRAESGPIITPPRRSAGMAFSKGPTYWRVLSVVPGSPAEEMGVQEGDLVTRINGESISKWPLQRFDAFVKRNTDIVFTFLDGAKERPVVIPTFDLVP